MCARIINSQHSLRTPSTKKKINQRIANDYNNFNQYLGVTLNFSCENLQNQKSKNVIHFLKHKL